jgi:topoisomerase-4 subunit A
VVHHFAGAAGVALLLASSAGYGLLARVADLVGRNRGGKAFLTLDEGQRVLPPMPVAPAHTQVACVAADSRLLVFPLAELKLQPGGGKGLTLMDVDAATPLLAAAPFADVLRVIGTGRGGRAKDELLKGAGLAEHLGKRARKGRVLAGTKVLRVMAPPEAAAGPMGK